MTDRETLAARADFATTQKELAKLQLEHRAVLAELYDRPGSRQDWIDRCYGVEARIEAALDVATVALLIPHYAYGDSEGGVALADALRATVKALRGEEE